MARTRRKAKNKKPLPAWLWLLLGILIGLGVSTWAILQGYIPQPKHSASSKQALPTPDKANKKDHKGLLEEAGNGKSKKPTYDFFTVLEEIEVAVPEREIRQQAETEASAPPDTANKAAVAGKGFVIQVGSFRNPQDAESMKAQLAFLGAQAHIQKVSIDGNSWQRVRIGPFTSAQEVESMRSRLSGSGIESRVYKVK